jgi:hypothetical protein
MEDTTGVKMSKENPARDEPFLYPFEAAHEKTEAPRQLSCHGMANG